MSLFDKLPSIEVSPDDEYTVFELDAGHFIAKDRDQFITMLIKTDESHQYPIQLDNLYIAIERLDIRKKNITQNFIVIKCKSHNELLISAFLNLIEILLLELEDNVKYDEVKDVIERLVKLFSSSSKKSEESIIGLWGELFCIYLCQDKNLMLESWRSVDSKTWDFTYRNFRFEVKTTSRNIRQHTFSLDQLNPPPDIQVGVCSIMVEKCDNGLSIFDLMQKIKNKCDEMLYVKFESKVIKTLGNKISKVNDELFNEEYAKAKILLTNSDMIPKVNIEDVPSAVTQVSFTSELPESIRMHKGPNPLLKNMG